MRERALGWPAASLRFLRSAVTPAGSAQKSPLPLVLTFLAYLTLFPLLPNPRPSSIFPLALTQPYWDPP